MKNRRLQRQLRHKRVARKIKRENMFPRLVVFRSNKYIYAQIVSDSDSKTLVAATDANAKSQKENNLEKAKKVGEQIAKAAIAKNVKKVVFDRAGYKFHGRVKALAEGAREGGLSF